MAEDIFRDRAPQYAAMGWRVFPIAPGQKFPPLVTDWPTVATCDPEAIAEWCEIWPRANIGLACGIGSGVFAVDVDVKNGAPGLESMKALQVELGKLPRGCVTQTASGGFHVLLEWPDTVPDAAITNSAGKLAPGIDVRGHHGYVVLAPSVLDGVGAYSWLKMGTPQPAPAAWIDRLTEGARTVGSGKTKDAAARMDRGDQVEHDQRNELFMLARELWQQLGNADRVADALWGECERRFPNTNPAWPWTRDDTDGIARDAKRYVHPLKIGAYPKTDAPVSRHQPAEPGTLDFSGLEGMVPLEAVHYGGRLNIPLGTLSILTGQQGTGKGLLMVSEAATLTEQGYGVVIASDEDSIQHTILPRLIAARADLRRIRMVGSLQLPEHADQLLAYAKANNVRLVIIDPWTNHMGDIDVNKGPELRAALMALKDAAQAGNFSVLLAAHPNKNTMNADPLERVAHSSAITQVARSAFWIVRDPRQNPGGTFGGDAENYKLVAQVKQNLTQRMPSYSAVVETRSIADQHPTYAKPVPVLVAKQEVEMDWLAIYREQQQMLKASRRDVDAPEESRAATFIREYLEDNGPTTAGSIEAAAEPKNISRATLKRAAAEARKAGWLSDERGKPWRLVG